MYDVEIGYSKKITCIRTYNFSLENWVLVFLVSAEAAIAVIEIILSTKIICISYLHCIRRYLLSVRPDLHRGFALPLAVAASSQK